MKIVLANAHTKGKRLDHATEGKVSGKGLSNRPHPLVRKTKSPVKKVKSELAHKLDSGRNDLTPEDSADAALITEHKEGSEMLVRVVSTSGDVIYNPGTQATQYSARRAVKSNLERRIPGASIRVNDIGGDGLVKLSLSIEYQVEDNHIELVAEGLASPSDMTIVSAKVLCNDKHYDIDPVSQARSPEDTAVFLKRLAANCASGG